MSRRICVTKEDVSDVLEGRLELPLRYLPAAMPHVGSNLNHWQSWENERFDEEMPFCIKLWSKKISRIKRELKLRRRRLFDSSYCKPFNYRNNKYCFDKDALELIESYT